MAPHAYRSEGIKHGARLENYLRAKNDFSYKKKHQSSRILNRNGRYKENVNVQTVRARNTVIFVKQRVLLRGITMLWILRELTLLRLAGGRGWFYGSSCGLPHYFLSCHEVTWYQDTRICNSDSNRRLRLCARQSLDIRLEGGMERCVWNGGVQGEAEPYNRSSRWPAR